MKTFIAVIAAVLMLGQSLCFASAKTIQDDKLAHVGASSVVEWLMIHNKPFNKWKPWQRGLLNVTVVGGGKEWYDHKHPSNHSAEWGDIAADFVGSAGAEGCVWLIHRSF